MTGRGIATGTALVVVVSLACAGAGPSDAGWRAKVDARVLADVSGGRPGRMLVVLRTQADVTAATSGLDRETQGRKAVVELHRAAARQAGVRAELTRRKVPFAPYWVVNAIATSGTLDLVRALARRPDVAAIETDRPTVTFAGESTVAAGGAPGGVEWNIAKIGAPDVWARGATGQGVVYASADTGVTWDAPTLKAHYRGWNGGAAVHDYNWWDAVHGDLSGNGGNPCGFSSRVPCDDHRPGSHGTSVMSIAVGDDGQGNQIGVAPGARWIGCRNMDEGVGSPSTYLGCLQFFLAPTDLNGANPDPSKRPHVVGNSYACPPFEGCSTGSLQAAIDNLRAAGVFLAVAAGNEGRGGCSTVAFPPSVYDSATTIGATDSADAVAVFSSRGPVTADGSRRLKPDLVAPGVGIRAATFDGFAVRSGTSSATPHVGGGVALLWSAFPDLRGQVDATELLLEESAAQLTTTEGCGGDTTTAVPNNTFGYGRLDVLAAFRAYEVSHPVQIEAAPVSVAEGNGGLTRMVVSLNLTRSATADVTVRYATRAGTATVGSDFRPAAGTVTIGAGRRSGELAVIVNGDLLREPDEVFSILLSASEGAQLATTSVEITIRNDDTDRVAPRISRLSVTPVVAAPASKRTARITLSEPAALLCRTERRDPGGWKQTATLRRTGVRGRQSLAVPGHRVAGDYRFGCMPTDPAGNVGRAVRTRFRIA